MIGAPYWALVSIINISRRTAYCPVYLGNEHLNRSHGGLLACKACLPGEQTPRFLVGLSFRPCWKPAVFTNVRCFLLCSLLRARAVGKAARRRAPRAAFHFFAFSFLLRVSRFSDALLYFCFLLLCASCFPVARAYAFLCFFLSSFCVCLVFPTRALVFSSPQVQLML